MKDIVEVRRYLHNEQVIASKDPASPEYQVFTALLNLADRVSSVDVFLTRAQSLPIPGPQAEVQEAKQWLQIALDTIQGPSA